MSTLHCALENGANLYVHEHQEIQHITLRRSIEERRRKKKKEEEECQITIFTSRGAYINCAIIAMLYTQFDWKSAVEQDGGVYNA